jgi:hypothetical protein
MDVASLIPAKGLQTKDSVDACLAGVNQKLDDLKVHDSSLYFKV